MRSRSRILCYHSVGTPQWGVNDVSPQTFRTQLELALSLGFRFVDASEIVAGSAGDKTLAVTFDDGLKSVLTQAAPILADLGIPWSLFVVTDWLDGRHSFGDDVILSWSEVESLAADGATIGSHSVSHPNFASIDVEEVASQLVGSRELIARRLGIDADTFAIPMGTSRDWTEAASRVAEEAGYRTVFAQSERRRSPGTVARTFVSRFDGERFFQAALEGKYDNWEEWT